jgi:hypothetical protein
MKKLAYISTIFIALALMSFSCTKPNNDPIAPTEIQAGDLVGSWYTQSMTFNGTTYTNVNYNTLVAQKYNYVTIDLKNVKEIDKTLTLHSDFNFNNSQLNVPLTDFDLKTVDSKRQLVINSTLTFEIDPSTDIALGKLVIVFKSPQTVTGSESKNPIGAKYTLTHSATN